MNKLMNGECSVWFWAWYDKPGEQGPGLHPHFNRSLFIPRETAYAVQCVVLSFLLHWIVCAVQHYLAKPMGIGKLTGNLQSQEKWGLPLYAVMLVPWICHILIINLVQGFSFKTRPWLLRICAWSLPQVPMFPCFSSARRKTTCR